MLNQPSISRSSWIKTSIALFLLLGSVAVIGQMNQDEPTTKAEAIATPVETQEVIEPSKSLKLGEIGHLTETSVYGLTEDAHDAMIKAAVVKDEDGLKELVMSGSAIVLPKGTKVKLIDPGFMKHKVRVTNGPQKGVAIYTPVEFVEAD